VERGEHDFRFPIETGEMVLDRLGDGLDIGRIVVIGRHGPERRLPAHVHHRLESLVVDRRRGCCGILRVEREQNDTVTAGILERLSLSGMEGWP
jgi:hypothetical protein